MKKCSVDGCSKPYRCTGFCNTHYRRWLLYGRTHRVTSYKRHGYNGHPLLAKLSDMKSRCRRHPTYVRRGIKVCREWAESAAAFVEWGLVNGWRSELTIDRIDPFGDYEPSNCQFLTQEENNKNVVHHENLYSAFGKSQSLRRWEEDTGIPYHTLWGRIKVRNWSVERAMTEPVHRELAGKFA